MESERRSATIQSINNSSFLPLHLISTPLVNEATNDRRRLFSSHSFIYPGIQRAKRPGEIRNPVNGKDNERYSSLLHVPLHSPAGLALHWVETKAPPHVPLLLLLLLFPPLCYFGILLWVTMSCFLNYSNGYRYYTYHIRPSLHSPSPPPLPSVLAASAVTKVSFGGWLDSGDSSAGLSRQRNVRRVDETESREGSRQTKAEPRRVLKWMRLQEMRRENCPWKDLKEVLLSQFLFCFLFAAYFSVCYRCPSISPPTQLVSLDLSDCGYFNYSILFIKWNVVAAASVAPLEYVVRQGLSSDRRTC